eukprot:scaffold105764_cov28-Tisochrysis_lutea.AAC.2
MCTLGRPQPALLLHHDAWGCLGCCEVHLANGSDVATSDQRWLDCYCDKTSVKRAFQPRTSSANPTMCSAHPQFTEL